MKSNFFYKLKDEINIDEDLIKSDILINVNKRFKKNIIKKNEYYNN